MRSVGIDLDGYYMILMSDGKAFTYHPKDTVRSPVQGVHTFTARAPWRELEKNDPRPTQEEIKQAYNRPMKSQVRGPT